MFRLLIAAVILVLAACTNQGTGSNSAQPSASGGVASQSAAASGASGTSGTSSAACQEAFAPLAEMDIESLTDLGDLEEVDATVSGCESVADWTATAEEQLGVEVRPGTVRMLLEIRCSDPALSSAPLCAEL